MQSGISAAVIIFNSVHFLSRGEEFITDHLRMEDVECYWEKLLKKYSKLLKFTPTKNKSFKQITPKKSWCICNFAKWNFLDACPILYNENVLYKIWINIWAYVLYFICCHGRARAYQWVVGSGPIPVVVHSLAYMFLSSPSRLDWLPG